MTPIHKYRDVSEMPDSWREAGDPNLFRVIAAVWDFADRTLKRRFPPGLYKHSSVEAAERLRSEWGSSNLESHRVRIRPARPPDS